MTNQWHILSRQSVVLKRSENAQNIIHFIERRNNAGTLCDKSSVVVEKFCILECRIMQVADYVDGCFRIFSIKSKNTNDTDDSIAPIFPCYYERLFSILFRILRAAEIDVTYLWLMLNECMR